MVRLSLFAALDVASGFVIGKCYSRHRATEFLDFLKRIDAQVPNGLDVHIIMDNYGTHKTLAIKRMAGAPTALSCAFYANIGIMDQPSRTMVRRAHPQAVAARRPYLDPSARSRYPLLHRAPQ